MTDQQSTGEAKDLATLYAKIARVTAAMKRVPKHGENKFQHYKYATESDIVDTLREAMGNEKIAILPRVDRTERIEHPNERLGPITRLYMTFTVACGDTGASVQMPWIGDGQDTADKGLYKAYTGAEKYFLMKLFLVATGDDPEQDVEPQAQPPRKAPQPQPVQSPLVDTLGKLRKELAASGGKPSNLTWGQIKAMSEQELQEEIALTRDELKRIKQAGQPDLLEDA